MGPIPCLQAQSGQCLLGRAGILVCLWSSMATKQVKGMGPAQCHAHFSVGQGKVVHITGWGLHVATEVEMQGHLQSCQTLPLSSST